MTARIKPPVDRLGQTRKFQLGKVEIYITLNRDADGRPLELFGKATEGHQGWLNVLCETASLYLQQPGGTIEELGRHWRGQRFPPHGIAGQASSIPDAIARWLAELGEKGKQT